MIWVAIVGGLALAGVIALVVYGVALTHKVADVRGELTTLNERAAQLRTLMGQLELPSRRRD